MTPEENITPTEDSTFVLTEDDAVAVGESEEGTGTTEEAGKFSVIPHLAVIGMILFGLFSTVVIPKTLSFLHPTTIPITVTSIPIEPASVAKSFIEIETIPIRARAAFVWDIANQKMLYSKNADSALPLASITKLMTALVSYELVTDNTPVTISGVAANQQSGGTIKAGEKFKVKELADFALITSYNSAAYSLAAAVGEILGDKDPTTQFVVAMNIRAEELGLESLSFANPTGLDVSATKAGAYGSAKDVSLLVEYIFSNYPEILRPTITPVTRVYNSDGAYHEAENTNEIVTDIPNLLGSKTGYTDLAGGNLTIIFDAGYNHPIVITVLGSTRSERFSDVKKLIAGVQGLLVK